MTTVYIAFVMCTHSLSSLFPALLIVEHIEGVSDSLCVAQKQGADERVVIFLKMAAGYRFVYCLKQLKDPVYFSMFFSVQFQCYTG